MSEISVECVFEYSRFPGFEIDRYYIKAHITILDFLFFNINKGCIKEFLLLLVMVFLAVSSLRRPGLDSMKQTISLSSANMSHFMPAAKILFGVQFF
jgi:hypothetical protein